jgi:hypothetical protein
MSPSLATFILLSSNLFSTSASFLKITKPFPEKLSAIKSLTASPIVFTSASLSTAGLMSLTGYYATGIYSDSSCEAPILVTFTALNTCFPTSESTYESVKANSTYVSTVEYSDSLCTVAIQETVDSYSDGECVSDGKAYISETSTLTSDVAAITQR